MSADSPSNWILNHSPEHSPDPSPRSTRSARSQRSARSTRSARSLRSAESPQSVLTPEKSPPKGWVARQMQKLRDTRNNTIAKVINVNKELLKMNTKIDLLYTQINNSLFKRGWVAETTKKTVGLNEIPESSYLLYPSITQSTKKNYLLYPSKTQLNNNIGKKFFPLITDDNDRFLVWKAIIDVEKRTKGNEPIKIESLQPSFLHRLNPLTSYPNVRRLVNRMKQYNKLVERSMAKGGGNLTMKRKLNKRKTTKVLSKNKKIKSTYKKKH